MVLRKISEGMVGKPTDWNVCRKSMIKGRNNFPKDGVKQEKKITTQQKIGRMGEMIKEKKKCIYIKEINS